jgi:hypothetical protein
MDPISFGIIAKVGIGKILNSVLEPIGNDNSLVLDFLILKFSLLESFESFDEIETSSKFEVFLFGLPRIPKDVFFLMMEPLLLFEFIGILRPPKEFLENGLEKDWFLSSPNFGSFRLFRLEPLSSFDTY